MKKTNYLGSLVGKSLPVVAGRKLTINRGEFRLKFDQSV